MTIVYVINIFSTHELMFYCNREAMQQFIQKNYDNTFIMDSFDNKKEFCVKDGCQYHCNSYDNYDILEFVFNEGEELRFMQTIGMATECCCIIKTTKDNFFTESFNYMRHFAKETMENGDFIQMNLTKNPSYTVYDIEYYDNDGNISDLIRFRMFSEIQLN